MPVAMESRRMTADERERLSAIGGDPGARSDGWWAWPIALCAMAVGALLLLRWLEPLWGAGHRAAETLAPGLVAGFGAGLFLVLIAVWARRRSGRAARNNRRRLFGAYWDDLDAGVVDEERYEFLAAASARDGETGAPIHLLRVDERQCLVVFGEAGERRDPSDDAALPRRHAVLRRAPRSRHVLSLRFEGEALTSEPGEGLGWRTPGWELDGQLWVLDWDELVQRLR